jgi:outer membrane protein assembly factor BamB/lysophospholipase L1-like esterase
VLTRTVSRAIASATAVVTGALLLAASARALTPADACRLGKLRAARAHFVCRLGAYVKAKKAGGTPDVTRCDARLAAAWLRAEKKGQCPSSDDQAAVQAFVGLCTGGVAAALADGGPLPACVVSPASVRSSPAQEAAPSKCERLKLKRAADYSACRLRAAGRTSGSGERGTSPGRCDARFVASWTRAETKRGPCPSSHDETEIRLFLARCTDAVAAALAGGALPTCAPPVAVDDWPVFNRDHGNSRANTAEGAISPQNVGTLEPRWRVDGLSGVTSTPAVVDGVVYFGDWSGVLHAVRTIDGTEIWSRQVGSPIRASPLVARNRVYAPESNGTLHAVDRATGDVVWAAPIDTQPFVSIDSSPILAGDTIVVGVESFEQVIRRPDYAFRGNVVGLDADTGAERWRVYSSENDATSGAGASVWSSAAVDEARKLVFIGTGQAYEQPAGPRTDALIAIRYDSGEVAWVRQFTTEDVFTVSGGGPGADADVGAAPNLFAIGSRDVVGVGQKNGVYHVVDRDTGEVVWEVALTPGSPLGGIMVTAAVHDGVVYVNSNRWRAFAFVSGGGHSPLDTSSTFALDARDGTVLWETPMPAPMFGALTFANGVVYHATIDGTVHALSATDGTELWSDKPGGDMAGGLSVVGGVVYAGRGFWFFTQPPAPNGGLVAYGLPDHWVGTWSTSPVCYDAARILGLPPSLEFDDQSVRMIVHTSIGGDTVRVRLTNHCGSTPLDVGAAAIGLRDAGARLHAGTVRPLTFAGQPAVAIPPGSTATSDPVALSVPPSSDVAVTLYLPAETLPSTSHPQAATGYLSGGGDFTQDVDGTSFPTTVGQWFFLDAVEVLVGGEVGAIVAFGDSIIDGAGTTYDANRRWPDYLARRLGATQKPFGVLNQGINGNRLLNSLLGDSALLRFDRDVLGQAGVRYVILLAGINDIGVGNPDVTADQVIAGYRELIDRAHAAGLRIFGGTLTPAEGTPYPFYEPYEESKRVAINQFIRESGAFDAVLDFAAAVSDPADPSRWKPGLSADALHPTDAGAETLAGAVDLSLFR